MWTSYITTLGLRFVPNLFPVEEGKGCFAVRGSGAATVDATDVDLRRWKLQRSQIVSFKTDGNKIHDAFIGAARVGFSSIDAARGGFLSKRRFVEMGIFGCSGGNCMKIGLPGKLILGKRKGLQEVIFS